MNRRRSTGAVPTFIVTTGELCTPILPIVYKLNNDPNQQSASVLGSMATGNHLYGVDDAIGDILFDSARKVATGSESFSVPGLHGTSGGRNHSGFHYVEGVANVSQNGKNANDGSDSVDDRPLGMFEGRWACLSIRSSRRKRPVMFLVDKRTEEATLSLNPTMGVTMHRWQHQRHMGTTVETAVT